MTISRDRVIFTLNIDCLDAASRSAFARAFGLKAPDRGTRGVDSDGNIQVRCRPSQFARFLIYRNDEGGRNGFKNLAPRLVPAERGVFDVSNNPASVLMM